MPIVAGLVGGVILVAVIAVIVVKRSQRKPRVSASDSPIELTSGYDRLSTSESPSREPMYMMPDTDSDGYSKLRRGQTGSGPAKYEEIGERPPNAYVDLLPNTIIGFDYATATPRSGDLVYDAASPTVESVLYDTASSTHPAQDPVYDMGSVANGGAATTSPLYDFGSAASPAAMSSSAPVYDIGAAASSGSMPLPNVSKTSPIYDMGAEAVGARRAGQPQPAFSRVSSQALYDLGRSSSGPASTAYDFASSSAGAVAPSYALVEQEDPLYAEPVDLASVPKKPTQPVGTKSVKSPSLMQDKKRLGDYTIELPVEDEVYDNLQQGAMMTEAGNEYLEVARL